MRDGALAMIKIMAVFALTGLLVCPGPGWANSDNSDEGNSSDGDGVQPRVGVSGEGVTIGIPGVNFTIPWGGRDEPADTRSQPADREEDTFILDIHPIQVVQQDDPRDYRREIIPLVAGKATMVRVLVKLPSAVTELAGVECELIFNAGAGQGTREVMRANLRTARGAGFAAVTDQQSLTYGGPRRQPEDAFNFTFGRRGVDAPPGGQLAVEAVLRHEGRVIARVRESTADGHFKLKPFRDADGDGIWRLGFLDASDSDDLLLNNGRTSRQFIEEQLQTTIGVFPVPADRVRTTYRKSTQIELRGASWSDARTPAEARLFNTLYRLAASLAGAGDDRTVLLLDNTVSSAARMAAAGPVFSSPDDGDYATVVLFPRADKFALARELHHSYGLHGNRRAAVSDGWDVRHADSRYPYGQKDDELRSYMSAADEGQVSDDRSGLQWASRPDYFSEPHNTLDAFNVGVDPHLLVVSGAIRADGTGVLLPAWQAEGITDAMQRNRESHELVLSDSAGEVLWKMPQPGPGDGQSLRAFIHRLPEMGGARLELKTRWRETVLAAIGRSADSPAITAFTVSSRRGGMLVKAQIGDGDGDTLHWLLGFGRDESEQLPLVMGTDFPREGIFISSDSLPGTATGRFKLTVTDGWNTVRAVSDGHLAVRDKGPEIEVAEPRIVGRENEQALVLLQMYAYDLEDGFSSNLETEWKLGRDKIGDGRLLYINLPAGVHEITLTVRDSGGNRIERRIPVVVADVTLGKLRDGPDGLHPRLRLARRAGRGRAPAY